jgi:hypothetical protein
MHRSQDDYIAQQKAEEAVESVFFARDIKLYSWRKSRILLTVESLSTAPCPFCILAPMGWSVQFRINPGIPVSHLAGPRRNPG